MDILTFISSAMYMCLYNIICFVIMKIKRIPNHSQRIEASQNTFIFTLFSTPNISSGNSL